jgi:predicted enzyme related to lactoylglutathione lyase
MAKNPVVHWEIGARDAAATGKFYSELFGWTVDTGMPGYGLVAAQEVGIGGGIMQAPEGVPPYVSFYVSVDDLQASLDKATSLGANVVVPPTEIPGVGQFAMFLDPEGRAMGIIKEAA